VWCPVCADEFQPGILQCPDCDIDLVADEPTVPADVFPPPLPKGLGWLGSRSSQLHETYGLLRRDEDPISAFELTLAEVLSEADYERIQSFFDGERDAIYGGGAGERARRELEARLEFAAKEQDRRRPAPSVGNTPEPVELPAADQEAEAAFEVNDWTTKWGLATAVAWWRSTRLVYRVACVVVLLVFLVVIADVVLAGTGGHWSPTNSNDYGTP
jgi:hypothetical protein